MADLPDVDRPAPSPPCPPPAGPRPIVEGWKPPAEGALRRISWDAKRAPDTFDSTNQQLAVIGHNIGLVADLLKVMIDQRRPKPNRPIGKGDPRRGPG